MRTEEKLRELIRLSVIEEMNVTNLITQSTPDKWVPMFIDTLTHKIFTLVLDEITYREGK